MGESAKKRRQTRDAVVVGVQNQARVGGGALVGGLRSDARARGRVELHPSRAALLENDLCSKVGVMNKLMLLKKTYRIKN